jgi:hypothetical protein
MTMSDMSDFQKSFLAKGVGNTLFTQKEFDDALNMAKAEIMAMAIEASRTAVLMEREACAKIVEEWSDGITDPESKAKQVAELIRNRIPSQRN